MNTVIPDIDKNVYHLVRAAAKVALASHISNYQYQIEEKTLTLTEILQLVEFNMGVMERRATDQCDLADCDRIADALKEIAVASTRLTQMVKG